MMLGQAERYRVEQGSQGICITLDQRKNAAGFGIICASLLGAGWWISPYGPWPLTQHTRPFWVWFAFLGLMIILAMVGWCYKERWIIGDRTVSFQNSFRWKEREVPREHIAKWRWVEVQRRSPRDHVSFAYRLQFVDREGQPLFAAAMDFQRYQGAKRFLALLQPILDLAVDNQVDEENRE